MSLRAVSTGGLQLRARSTGGLGLRARHEPRVVRFGFESDEAWTLQGTTLTTERSHAGTASLKYNGQSGTDGGALVRSLGDSILDMEFHAWLYLEGVPENFPSLNIQMSLFDESFNSTDFKVPIAGLASGSWLELSTVKTSQTPTPPTGISLAIVSMKSDVVMFLDDISFRPIPGQLKARRTS